MSDIVIESLEELDKKKREEQRKNDKVIRCPHESWYFTAFNIFWYFCGSYYYMGISLKVFNRRRNQGFQPVLFILCAGGSNGACGN